MTQTIQPLLQLTSVAKRFGGVIALRDVSMAVRAGEVMALVGENGAGKSTLVKILTGIYQPDGGSFGLDGRPLVLRGPQAAARAGITAVHQETVMFDELSVAENIYLGHQPRRGWTRRIDWPSMESSAQTLLRRLEVDIPVRAKVKDLSIAQRHFVEIARALSQDARVVIMDEPTAALSRQEIHELYRIVGQLKAAGKAVIFITHKFDEIFSVCDSYTVLRDGQFIASGALADIDEAGLVALMVGRSVSEVYPKAQVAPGETVLDVRGLSHPSEFDEVSFSLRRGEVLGVYGLVGAGRSETMQGLFGLTPDVSGEVRIDGRQVVIHSAAEAIRHGLALVPEDRQHHGAMLEMSILENSTLACLDGFGKLLAGKRQAERDLARRYAERLELKAAHFEQAMQELSGGNQQKVVLAKWLATNPKVIILDEPTKGIDIGSKAAVHRFISQLVGQGLAVVLVSSELPEVLGLSDRIMVMYHGRVQRTFTRAEASAELVVAAASGLAPQRQSLQEVATCVS
ncbi:sugar ABC transporter ATP-binding protein [Duganella radicis]|uniref:ATP-binding cassette domain-containing protein n=1 Tax=Duganella radicis TaxID=551988 RepID=A0A6L6PRJ1_9BURK|nr:sugar ABC transporter ATP-binding protein [Duganella radicis]MTV41444.1 ATP-binding cassette domain-containing protein [Duganella radicis]